MASEVSILQNPNAGLLDEFGDGQVLDNAAMMFPVPTSLAALPQSSWYVAEWGQPVYINSADYTINKPSSDDPIYGTAAYDWSEPGTTSEIKLYNLSTSNDSGYVFDLTDNNTNTNGSYTNESDMFLSGAAKRNNLAHQVTLSLDAKLIKSNVQFYNSSIAEQYAQSSGVFGTFDIGLTINFNGAQGIPGFSGFVQIVPWTSDTDQAINYQNGAISLGEPRQFISSRLLSGDPALSVLPADRAAEPDTLTYNVNNYVYQTLLIAFGELTGTARATLLNLANWSIGGIYVGPATNDPTIAVPPNWQVVPAATETTEIQISNISLTSDPNILYHHTTPVQPVGIVDSNPQIQFFDETTDISGTADGSQTHSYWKPNNFTYLYNGYDDIDLSAPTGNWTFGGGNGETRLTASTGDDILLASSGGSLMISGSGNDTFEIPDINISGLSVSDTISGFQANDILVVQDFDPRLFSFGRGKFDGAGSMPTLTITSIANPSLSDTITFENSSQSAVDSISAHKLAATAGLYDQQTTSATAAITPQTVNNTQNTMNFLYPDTRASQTSAYGVSTHQQTAITW